MSLNKRSNVLDMIMMIIFNRNRGKRSASTTNERPPFTQHMNRDSRASNKYETIDISRGSRPNAPNSTDTNAPNSTDRVRHTLRYGSTCISTIDIVDVSKLSPTIERVTSAHLELETDDTYNHIGESAKVYIKNGNFNEQTASNRRDNVLWFTNNIGIGELLQNDVDNMKDNDTDEMPISRNMKCRDTFSFNRYQANYENVELEGPVSEINPYFILEQYDQYDHLGTVQPTGDAYRTSGQSISDSEYNEIRFTKSEVVADPNYGVLCQDIPPEAVENDTTYSHLGDSDVRASAAFTTDYAKVTLEVTN